MGASNGTRRKATEGLSLYTNQLYYKSFPGEPTRNLLPTVERNSDFDVRVGGVTHSFYRIYKDKDPDQQGMYNSFVSGSMSNSDVVYKYAFPDVSTNNAHSKHGLRYFSLDIGSEYILSAEVFVSKKHIRETGSKWPVLSTTPVDQPTSYGYYDFTKKGTWQVVTIPIKPSVFEPAVSTAGTSGTSGTSGTAGTAGTSGIIKKSISYAVYMWPTATCPIDKYGSGYIIYKNLQLEKNTHRTQFARGESGGRLTLSGLKDLSGNANSLNLSNISFDSNAEPVLNSGNYFDIGLTQKVSSGFSVGNSRAKTYEFWVKLDNPDLTSSTLLYSDVSQDRRLVSNDNVSKRQHVYVLNNRVYCDVYNDQSISTSSFTNEALIKTDTIHHILVSINMELSSSKIKIFVDGNRAASSTVKPLVPPADVSSSVSDLGGSRLRGFRVGNKVNYRISSFNEKGESVASKVFSSNIKNSSSSITLSWSNVPEASKFLIYRSINSLGEFSNASLIAEHTNPLIGIAPSSYVFFEDDGSLTPTSGKPKTSYSARISERKTSFFDSSSMKLAIGSYPNAASVNSVGNIYRVNVYKKAFSADEALASYIQGVDDFKSSPSASVGASAGVSVGGSGGGY